MHALEGATLDRDWWRMFQSAALDAVVKRALEGNRTLVAANATLAQTSELARAQTGSLYPQINMTAGLGRQKYGAEFFGSFQRLPPFTYYALGPTVSYALWTRYNCSLPWGEPARKASTCL